MGGLTSAPIAVPGPADHVRGPARAVVAIVYGDFECPYCAVIERKLRLLPVRTVFRHFPVKASHPRALPAACAAEAAALQDAFWPMHDALFDDPARLEDPHLWARAERLGLDLARFDADRRAPEVAARVEADFRNGIRGGVATTPTVFVDGRAYSGRPTPELWQALGCP